MSSNFSMTWSTRTLELLEFPTKRQPNDQVLSAVGLALKGLQSVTLDINLMPPAMRKKPSRNGQLLSLLLVVLVIISGSTWIGRTVWGAMSEYTHLNEQIDQLAVEVRSIEQIQSDISALEKQLAFARSLQPAPAVNTLSILKELSQLIPSSAWVRDLNFRGQQVRIDGYADDSAQLIPILDQSPLFTNVMFLATITKGRDGNERFRIGFDVVTPLAGQNRETGKNRDRYHNPKRREAIEP